MSENQCSSVSPDGLPCRKPLHFFLSENAYGDHAGGHVYMNDRTEQLLYEASIGSVHMDNMALLSGQPAEHHKAVDCDQTGFCSWRR